MSSLLDILHVPLALELNYPPLIEFTSIDYRAVRDTLWRKLSEYPPTMLLNEFCQKCKQKKPDFRSYNDSDGFIRCNVTINGQKYESVASHTYETEAKNDAAKCALFDIFNSPDRVYIDITEQHQMKTYVSRLNELCQQRGYSQPEYVFEKRMHGDFKCKVLIDNLGVSRSGVRFPKKQQAKEDAARVAYEDLCRCDTSPFFY